MSRAVPIWVGKTDDSAIPQAVKLRIWSREGGRCSLTGRKIMPGEPFDYEHRVPLSMGGKHDETNIVLALREAHRKKTASEASARAKADRIKAKHLGVYPKGPKIPSRPFQKRRAM